MRFTEWSRFTAAVNLRRSGVVHWFTEVYGKAKYAAVLSWTTLVQIASGFAVLYGISFWSVPCALIVGGLAGVVAVELNSGPKEPVDDPAEDQKIRAQIDAALSRGRNPFDSELVPMSAKWLTYVALLRRSKNAE